MMCKSTHSVVIYNPVHIYVFTEMYQCPHVHTKTISVVVECYKLFISNQTEFVFPTENPSEPFGASVIIDGVTYGTGTASSKKLAKNKAGNFFYLQYLAMWWLVGVCHI